MALNDVKEIQIPNPALKPIPSGYRQYEYLNRNPSDNYAYIDLGIKATSNTDIECEFSYNDSTGTAGIYNRIIFGSAYSDIDTTNIIDGIVLYTYVGENSTAMTSLAFRYGDGAYPRFDYDQYTSGTKYKFKNEGGSVYINDVLNNNLSNTSGSFSHILGNIMIGAAGNANGGVHLSASNFNLYSFKVWENNVLVKDLVPVVETATSIAGVYDLVNNEFLSPTRGTFTAVNILDLTVDVKQIQDSNSNIIWGSQSAFPYRILEYIDIPTGCYISTNDNGSATIAYYLDVNWNLNGDSISTAQYPFGSIYYNGSTYYRYHLATHQNGNMQAASASGTYTTLFSVSNTSQRHIVELNYHTYNDKRAYADNVDKGSFNPTSGTNTGYIRIGGRLFDNNGTISINDYPHTIRVYSVKQKTGAQHDTIFYPVQRKSDGKIGLLKIYNNGAATRFCTTETSTEPTAGPVVNEYFSGDYWPD